MRRQVSAETWEQVKVGHASGIGLRELARNMGLAAGTVLARSKREGWTQQIATAKLIKRPELARELAKPDAINAITPTQSAAISTHERKQRLLGKALRIADKAADRMENQIAVANIGQATIAFGVSTEKALLLAGEPACRMEVDLRSHDIHADFLRITAEIREAVKRVPPPASETPLLEAEIVSG